MWSHGVRVLTREGILLGGHVPTHCIVPTHECSAHCSPAAAGECACQAHAADECIRSREGDKTAMRPFAKLLWEHCCILLSAVL